MTAVSAGPGDASAGERRGCSEGTGRCGLVAGPLQGGRDHAGGAGRRQVGDQYAGYATAPGPAAAAVLPGHNSHGTKARVRFRPMVGRDTRVSVVSSCLTRHIVPSPAPVRTAHPAGGVRSLGGHPAHPLGEQPGG